MAVDHFSVGGIRGCSWGSGALRVQVLKKVICWDVSYASRSPYSLCSVLTNTLPCIIVENHEEDRCASLKHDEDELGMIAMGKERQLWILPIRPAHCVHPRLIVPRLTGVIDFFPGFHNALSIRVIADVRP